ncbi:OLC1v1000294C1 [Oldenlandia corymbosa var. corymbosa]|uniref:OLC1v1000294C1 n=1 Tax=Oldenlandia corymbosa var. corymbosa TaxID=529605 RepID=A0AAV1D5B2_OLDCO|nr:OLC1v1000294C1 [Oldenlandia corymbosa var. corymbosa]
MKSVLYYDDSEDLYHHNQYQSHFLDSCFLCQRPLPQNSDIFMYRGNTPFCSQECRQEQIEIDEAKERRWNRSSNKKQTTDSRKESAPNKAIRTGAVAVA